MTALTHDQVKEIVGPIDEEKLAAIVATGAKLEDIVEATALAAGKSDIAGQGERPVRGPVTRPEPFAFVEYRILL